MSDKQSDLKQLEEEFRKNSQDMDAAVTLARSHLDAGNDNRAKEVLDKLIKTDASAGPALVLRAEVLSRRNDWVSAERDCRLARRAKAGVPWKMYAKAAYFRWLQMADKGWRPSKLSRIVTLVMCASTGLLLTAMGVRLLLEGAFLGFFLSLAMGLGFFWGGLMVGGVSLWLKTLQDRMTPGWDEIPHTGKKRKQAR